MNQFRKKAKLSRISMHSLRMNLARLVAYSFMVFCLLTFSGSLLLYPSFAAAHPDHFLAWGWTQAEMDSILIQVGLSFNRWVQWNLVTTVLFAVLLCGIAVLILSKRQDDWFSLYVATAFIFFSTQATYTGAIISDAFPLLKPVLSPMNVFAWLSLLLIFYAFPNGHFVPGWMGWIAGLLVILYAIDESFYQGKTPPPLMLLVMFVLIGMGVASQVYRYLRSSPPIQRQQTKWVIFSMLVVFSALMTLAVPVIAGGKVEPASPTALFLLLMASFSTFIIGLIPLSIAIAILRYRLWDIDVIIRKTVVYTIVTGLLALVYFGGTVLLQGVFSRLTGGSSSPLVTVISTLGIVILFSPLRRRVQAGVDRRFYRQKYDAEQTLQAFAAHARDEVELERLSAALVSAVEETVQPEEVSLWLTSVQR